MNRVLYLFLILALTLGGLFTSDASSAKVPDTAMQMGGLDQTCEGCPSTDVAGLICDSGCTVPCGLGGSTGMILPQIYSTQFSEPFGLLRPRIKPLLPVGTAPALDPFPPKHLI